MKNKKALYITQAAMIAALYVVLTVFINAFNLASGAIQVRISEALCILPVFTPAAIPGLFIGCLLANLVTGAMIWDIIFGSLATLLGAIGTYYLRKTRFAFTLPPVIANMIVIPPVLMLAYHVPDAWWFLVITVGLGEVISVCILGFILKKALWNFRYQIFRIEERA
ncbi:MAG: QueT transporter family protein [Lachnospiraceae bacterium]|nr:QueT transporter family protein [Lachnospiraceae bacterium]